MSVAEFEEKEFEGPRNGQLGLGGPLWSPGQVLEKLVGFDVAMLTINAVFWVAVGVQVPPQGAAVLPVWWPSALNRRAWRLRHPPSFKMNVFLQHKRPEYLSRSSASEWATWNTAYFRFLITPHQQVALEACASALGQNGLVAYASPAFHARVDLFGHIENHTLVANTHFAPALALKGHGRYTYKNATTSGVAHSEPSRVEPLTILNGGGSGGDNGGKPPEEPPGGGDGRSPTLLLSDARKAVRAAITASPMLVGSKALFDAAVDRTVAILKAIDVDITEPLRDYIDPAMFSAMSGIDWLVLPVS